MALTRKDVGLEAIGAAVHLVSNEEEETMNGILTRLSGNAAVITGATVWLMLTVTMCYMFAAGEPVTAELYGAWGLVSGVGVGSKIPTA